MGNRPEGRALILLYHRVAKLRSDPWANAVTPQHFDEHLKVLRQHARPIRLQQLSQALLDGSVPDRSVVITFDDGYADNLYNAKPLLTHYRVPATVFLVTRYIGYDREFWWDELDRLLLQPGTLPEKLRLNLSGNTYHWQLGEAARYDEDTSLRHSRWRVWREAPSPRHSLYKSLWELLHPLTEGERQRVLDDLIAWAGLGSVARPSHRSLSLEEVVALDQEEIIEVGAHTVTHPALPTLPAASQREEIRWSKARLEEILRPQVTSFAYPYGSLSAETVDLVREAGFTCACSTVAKAVGPPADLFRLPRVTIKDWSGRKFTRQLLRWFSD
jgi:peptidoglycan/xylan/chitin deacetylase (PgdA/CDA1 family)